MSKLSRLFILTLHGKIYATTLNLDVMAGYMAQEPAMVVTQEHLVQSNADINPLEVYCVQWFDELEGRYSRVYHTEIDRAVSVLKAKKSFSGAPGSGYSDVTIETVHLV